jgi:hypothetical protein
MARGGIDYTFVEQQRALDRSWSAIAKMQGVTEDRLRRDCDPDYKPVDCSEAAARTPRLASGRENRPVAYEPPTPRVDTAPPASNAITMPAAPRRKPEPMAQPAPAPVYRRAAPRPADPPPVQPPACPPDCPGDGFAYECGGTCPEPDTAPTTWSAKLSAGPSAHQVALALVAAARVTGENPVDFADLGKGLGQGGGRRFRWPAFAALVALFPGCPGARLARCVGIPDRPAPLSRLGAMRGGAAAWWPGFGDRAVEAAMAAVEIGGLAR